MEQANEQDWEAYDATAVTDDLIEMEGFNEAGEFTGWEDAAYGMNNTYEPLLSPEMLLISNTVTLFISVLMLVTMWKVFVKAGQPGWKSIIPLYNFYTMLKIINRPWWWMLLLIVPIVNIVIFIKFAIEFAKVFNKGWLFGAFMLTILAPIGYPILAFGKSTYSGLPARG